jgi:hypothetical protein
MLLIDQFKHIKNRADFFMALDDAIQRTQTLMNPGPNTAAETSILRQLQMIKQWTANGRQPTKEERWKPNILLRLTREYEGVSDPVWEDWVNRVGDVAYYFERWYEDSLFQTVRTDQVPHFPEDEDDVTHLRK